MKRWLPTITAIALLTGACGGGNSPDSGDSVPTAITPSEAMEQSGEVAVQGFLWADRPESMQLCSSILESFPPQCGRPAIGVTGIDITTVAGADFFENIFWAEGVRAIGTITDGALVADRVAFASSANGLNARILVPIEVTTPDPSWTILLSNAADAPIEMTFTSGQDADVLMTNEDVETVYTWSATSSFTQQARIETLEPGETRRLFLAGVPHELDRGTYDLEATIVGRPRPGPMIGTIQIR